MSNPQKIERFGPEWWALYAAAWQALWPASVGGTSVREKNGWTKLPADVPLCVRHAVREADEGMDAFNGAIEKIGDKT